MGLKWRRVWLLRMCILLQAKPRFAQPRQQSQWISRGTGVKPVRGRAWNLEVAEVESEPGGGLEPPRGVEVSEPEVLEAALAQPPNSRGAEETQLPQLRKDRPQRGRVVNHRFLEDRDCAGPSVSLDCCLEAINDAREGLGALQAVATCP